MNIDLLATEIVYRLDDLARDYDSQHYGLPIMSHDDEMKKLVIDLINKELNLKTS